MQVYLIVYIWILEWNNFFKSSMHFSEILFSSNLETLKFKNFPFWASYADVYHGITKQVNSFLDSNFKTLVAILCNYKIIRKQNN